MGLHTIKEEAGVPSTPGAAYWRLYFKSDGLYMLDDAGVETKVDTGGVTADTSLTETFWVDKEKASAAPDGSLANPFLTIQDGIDAITDVGVVRVAASPATGYGYNESLSIVDKNVVLLIEAPTFYLGLKSPPTPQNITVDTSASPTASLVICSTIPDAFISILGTIYLLNTNPVSATGAILRGVRYNTLDDSGLTASGDGSWILDKCICLGSGFVGGKGDVAARESTFKTLVVAELGILRECKLNAVTYKSRSLTDGDSGIFDCTFDGGSAVTYTGGAVTTEGWIPSDDESVQSARAAGTTFTSCALLPPPGGSASLYGNGTAITSILGDITLTEPLLVDRLTVSSTNRLFPDGFPVFVKDMLVMTGGKIFCKGAGGVGGTIGGAGGEGGGVAGGFMPGTKGGEGGGDSGHDQGYDGVGGCVPAAVVGGAGGDHDAGGGIGGASGTPTNPEQHHLANPFWALQGRELNGSGLLSGGVGGGGGGGQFTTADKGAGGGGGGGTLVIFARKVYVDAASFISADGGSGGKSDMVNCGGGGGGSGGTIILVYDAIIDEGAAITVNGGGGGAGSGTAFPTDGAAGAAGSLLMFPMR